MKPLKIGQPVKVSAVTEVGYEDVNRRTFRVKVSFKAVITGRRIKHLGILRTFGCSLLDEDYAQSELKVKEAITLWEVRTGMINKPFLVADEDLETCEEFNLPLIYRRF